MKISEVEVGAEYGAVERPRSRANYSRVRPRKVRAEEIVTREESRYTSDWTPRRNVQMRRVKVTFLDDPVAGHRWNEIADAPKDSTRVVEARQLVALWSEIGGEVEAKIALEQERDAQHAAMTARLEALGFRDEDDTGWAYITSEIYDGRVTHSLSASHGAAERLLELAEAGAAR